MNEPLDLAIEDAVATITLNRPATGNGIDADMTRALLSAAARLAHDVSVRCVVLTGTGKLFCGGGDINTFHAAGDDASLVVAENAGTFHSAIALLVHMDKPLVVAVNGPAAGAGLSLAVLGDIVLAAPEAHFSFGYCGAGVTPDGGASWFLPRVIGLRRAQEMALTNARVSAEDAAAMGLVTRVSPDPLVEARTLAAKLAAGPVRAFAKTRALLLSSFETSLETQLDREARGIAAAVGDPEGREGVAAFLARRPPDFSGT